MRILRLIVALFVCLVGMSVAQGEKLSSGPATEPEGFRSSKPMADAAGSKVAAGGEYLPFSSGRKFTYFAENTFEPFTFLGAGVEAGLSQLDRDNLGFGQGADGFGKRYGAAVADRVSFGFFALYALPATFHQDPRYFRRGEGSFGGRTFYSFSRAFVARSDRGSNAFNVSKIGGAFLSASLSNAYFPQGERTVGFTLRSAGLNVGTVVGFNLLREFGPDLKRKLVRRKK